MNLLFAKWIFTVSLQLVAGTGLEWPAMHAAQLAPPDINEMIAIEDIWTPGTVCPPVRQGTVSDCVPTEGGFTGGARHQIFCVQPGVYVVNLSLGMRAQLPLHGAASGRVWINAPGERILLMHLLAEPGAMSHQSGSAAIATETGMCLALTYDASGAAWIDPATTRLTIHRAGG